MKVVDTKEYVSTLRELVRAGQEDMLLPAIGMPTS